MYLKGRMLAVMLGIFAVWSVGRAGECPSIQEIKWIEERGKEIAAYERAAIRATDMLLATDFDRSQPGLYLALKNNGTWIVYFGNLSADRSRFNVSYMYACPDGRFNDMKPIRDIGVASMDALHFARAISLSLKAVIAASGGNRGKLNTNVFREDDRSITVYVMPGNEKSGVVLIGGDYKLSISSDGTEILKTSQLHKATLEVPTRSKEGSNVVGAYHIHVLTDLPTETEVALALLNPELTPHYIISQKWITRINKDGTITFLGETDTIRKKKSKMIPE